MKPFVHQKSPFLILVLFLLSPLAGTAQELDEQACRSLADLRLSDTNLLSAVVVPANDDMPEYCRVLGFVRPAINFEIKLPTANWNGKFFMHGCAGFCGRIGANFANNELKQNYAVSTTDGGHWGEGLIDLRWAFNNRLAEVDYAYRASHETVRVTKSVIEAFYGEPPAYSYFNGCSGGGRQGLMNAWRYPEDFDGIISGAPVMDMTGLLAVYDAWIIQANTNSNGDPIIRAKDVEIIREAVYSACDALDGLNDGIIDNPLKCTFDPASIQCDNADSKSCLAAEQVTTLKKWYSKPINSTGNVLYPDGVPLGSEPYWPSWLTGRETENGDTRGLRMIFNELSMRYLLFEQDPAEPQTGLDFDLDKDIPRLDFMSSILNADNPNIRAFKDRGGKLLIWHGWADVAMPPLKTINYYQEVEKLIGSTEETQNFLGLFLLPGAGHCGEPGGPGVSSGFNPLPVLEKWVEQNQGPVSILSTKLGENGNVLWEKPVCAYPKQAKYKGQGDVNAASSFECVDP